MAVHYIFFAAVLAVSTTFSAFAQDTSSPLRVQTPDELVQLLVSQNKPVNPKHEPFIRFPKSYDREAQKVVDDARVQLFKLGFSAIPELMRHIDDNRYCRTVSYSLLIDKAVGDECFALIDAIASPTAHPDFDALPSAQLKWVKGGAMRLGTDGKWDYVDLSYLTLLMVRDKLFTRESIGRWWEAFSDKSIGHIHLAGVRRLIAHEESIGFHSDSNKEQYLKPYRDLEGELTSRLQQK